MWANELNPTNGFNNTYGDDAIYARALVNRAIDDWNAVIIDQNFDNDDNPLTNDFNLTINAIAFEDLDPFDPDLLGVRGDTNITALTTGGPGQVQRRDTQLGRPRIGFCLGVIKLRPRLHTASMDRADF